MRVAARIVFCLLAVAGPAQVALPEPHEKALAALAPGGVIERRVVVLTPPAQASLQADLHDAELPRTWFVYVVRVDGAVVAIALFDTHRVRTLRETLLVAFDAELRLRSVEVVAFAEPRRYLPSQNYYARYEGRAHVDLEGRGVDAVSGATLTSKATGRAAVRALAIGAQLRAEDELMKWAAAVPAVVQAAAGPAHAAASARLRARFPDADVRPRTRLTNATGDTAWIAAFELAGDEHAAHSAYVHTTVVGKDAVSTLVVVAPDGSLHAEALAKDTAPSAVTAAASDVRAMLKRDGDGPGR